MKRLDVVFLDAFFRAIFVILLRITFFTNVDILKFARANRKKSMSCYTVSTWISRIYLRSS